MKNLSLVLVSTFAACQFLSAQQFNGDRKSYVSDLHAASLVSTSLAESAADALRSEGGLSLSGVYSSYDLDSDTERQYEGDRDVTGGTLGYVQVFDGVALGATLSFLQSDSEFDGTDANGGGFESDGDGIVFSLGAASQLGDFYLSIVGGWGEFSNDSERAGAFGRMEADYDTTFYFVETKLTYDWIVEEDYSVRPSVSLGFQSLEIDGFSEETASAGLSDRTDYESIEDDVFYAKLEILAEYYGYGRFVPYASVSAWHDLGDSEVELQGQSGVIQLSTDVPDLFETVFTGELGFSYNVNEQFVLGAAVAYFTGNELDGFDLGLSAVFSF